jgi:hypothetical protein
MAKGFLPYSVFGQLKAARGLRRFAVRGVDNVRAEFLLMALTTISSNSFAQLLASL